MKAGIPFSLDRHSAALGAARGLPPLLVAAQRVAATAAAGMHGRRRTGTGDSFWQFRPYTFGDSMARIDWRQSAKSDAVFLRDQEWEAAQSLWLWRDASASMDYRSDPNLPAKRACAEILTLALASLLLRSGERVALLGRKESPSASQTTLLHMAQRLSDVSGGDGLPPVGPVLRYGRVLLFSDFLTEADPLAARLRTLADSGVLGHLIQILDPAELVLPFAGRVRFLDSESQAELLTPRVEDIRSAYHARLAAHTAALRDLTRRVGWRFVRHVTNQAPSMTLMTLYQQLTGDTPRGRRIG